MLRLAIRRERRQLFDFVGRVPLARVPSFFVPPPFSGCIAVSSEDSKRR